MKKFRLLLAGLCCIFYAQYSHAVDKYWSCTSDSWDNDICWNPLGQPMDGDDVFLTQSTGTVTYSNTLYPNAQLNSLTVNSTGQDSVKLLQSQGLLSSITEYIGYDGLGIVTQTGGTNTVNDFYMGHLPTGNGTYNLSGTGSLVADNELISIDGNGIFNQTGGTNTANYLAVAYCSGSICSQLGIPGDVFNSGTYNMHAGNLSVVDMDIAVNYGKDIGLPRFGGGATGIFNQTGGNVTVSNILTLADIRSANGTYNLSEGSLSAGEVWANNFDMTGSGVANFNQDSGTVNTNRIFSLFSIFNYNLSDGSVTTNTIELSRGSNHFNQSGGVNVVTDTLTMDSISLYGKGYYTLSDGTLDAGNISIRGNSDFIQTGGIVKVRGDLTLAQSSIPTSLQQDYGEYTLDHGMLNAANITVESGSTFNFNGGTLTVDNFTGDLFNNGGTLAPRGSQGITNIFGDFGQSISGTLMLDIAGVNPGDFNALDIDGVATLGGILNVNLTSKGNGIFDPALGDTFDILMAETITGEFDTLLLAGLGNGLRWDVSYILDGFGTDIVRLSVQAIPIPPAIWLFGSGLLGLIGVARKKGI